LTGNLQRNITVFNQTF